jgi:hypothetical protein
MSDAPNREKIQILTLQLIHGGREGVKEGCHRLETTLALFGSMG